MTKSSSAKKNCVPGASRQPVSLNRFRAQMERAKPQRDAARGQRIKAARGKLTQPAVVEMLRRAAGRQVVTLRGLQEWEVGGGIRWENAKLLAAVLSTTAEEIMGVSEPAPADTDDLRDWLTRIEAKIDEVRNVLNEALGVSPQDEGAVPAPPEVLVRADSGESRTETGQPQPASLETRRRGRQKPTA